MTPLQLAANLAATGDPRAHALAVAMVARGLSDPDPSDPFRQGWPVEASLAAACTYLHLPVDTALIDAARAEMLTLTDAVLNRTPQEA